MALRERLIYAVEIVTDKGTKGLNDLRGAVGGAEGAMGKLKAGAGSLVGSLGTAGLMGVAAGAAGAVVAFGAKSVLAFTETAKAAIDLHTATGLGIEDSSRWIALADDYEVGAEALATGLGKVAKTLDSDKWKKYGVATHDAAGEARSVNDILLDSFDMLSKVANETDRARIGQELFGKGYQSLTPLLGHSREEYEKMLKAQKDGQVITEAEAAKAERARLAIDELKDSAAEIALIFGEYLAPKLADFVDTLTRIRDAVSTVKNAIESIPGAGFVLDKLGESLEWSNPLTATAKMAGAVDNLGGKIKGWFGGGGDAPEAIKYTSSASEQYAESLEMLAQQLEREQDEEIAARDARYQNKRAAEDYVDFLEGRHQDAIDAEIAANQRARDAAREHSAAVDQVRQAMERQLSAALQLVGGDIAVRESQRAAATAATELNAALTDQTLDAGATQAAIDDAAQAQLNAAGVAADYRARQMEANGETVNAQVQHQLFKEELTNVANTLTGPLADAVWGYIGDLANIPTSVNTQITMTRPGRVGDTWQLNGPRAAGGATYPGLHPVIENGPELLEQNGQTYLMSKGGGTVVPLSAATAGGAEGGGMIVNIPITVNAGLGTDGFQVGRQIVEVLDQYFRNGGQFAQNSLRLIRGDTSSSS